MKKKKTWQSQVNEDQSVKPDTRVISAEEF